MAPRDTNRPLTDDPFGQVIRPQLSLVHPETKVSIDDNVIKIDHPDGSTTIDFDADLDKPEGPDSNEFDRNLAMDMDDGELSSIASDLLDGIEQDKRSRQEWLDTRAHGITLLGLKLEKPRTDAGTSSAPLEGMAVVRHPALLEATVRFQATARGELLPSAGPVKVRNDAPAPPREDIYPDTSASKQLADSLANKDELAQALERDMNHYLTAIATEYVPDTDRMLFYIGFGGDGFKKVYNCPLRRRPVSESIDAEDLIVSNAATDLQNCGRITHVIKMRKSTLKRMQILEVYRDVDLSPPSIPMPTALDKKKEDVAGYRPSMRPEDRDYTIYEVYCELDLDQFAAKEFKGKGLPLPYRVTIEEGSRQVLDLRRNWDEDDDNAMPKQYFVQFPFIRGLGFYGLGYIHLLGNATNALTAAWRLMLDAGMFANFPGFLMSKGAGRQNTNTFRVAPGTGVPIDVGVVGDIRQAVMPLPYKEVGQSFSAFAQHVEEVVARLASTASIQVGEGKQDAPVGTTLALIEQASKLLDSAHKRLHAAQAEEFKLLKKRFREDPEAFWRHNKRPTIQWKKDQFIEALNNCELVPVADPNNPTSLHRIAKAMAIKTLQQASPDLYDPIAVDMRIMRIVDIDPEGLFRPAPAPQPPDPRMVAIQQKSESEKLKSQINLIEAQIKAETSRAALADKAQDRASKEKIEGMKIQLEQLRIQEEQIIHQFDQQRIEAQSRQKMHLDATERAQKMQTSAAEAQLEAHGGLVKTALEVGMEKQHHDAEMARAQESHQQAIDRIEEQHRIKLEQQAEAHKEKLAQQRELTRAKKQSIVSKPKGKS